MRQCGAYRSYRQHQRYLRLHYPPTNDQQRAVLSDYDDAIREMADQLRKADRLVQADALTRADAWAKWLAVEYQRLRNES